MAEKQRNERSSTRYEGVYQRESRVNKYKGKPDVCYSIDYRDPATGQRVRKSIGWRSKGVTAEFAHNARISLIANSNKEKFSEIVPTAQDVLTLEEAWTMYRLDWLEARQAASLRADTSNFNNHLKIISHLALSDITPHDIEALSASLLRAGFSAQTAKHVLGLIRRIMRKIIAWEKWQGPTPFCKVTMPKVNAMRKRYLSTKEAISLLDLLHKRSQRMYHMSLISLHCGLRFGEIASLRFYDIDFHSKTLLIRDPKNGKDRHAYMTEAVVNILRGINGAASSLVFPDRKGNVMREKTDVFNRCVAALGLNDGITDRRHKVVFHTLRHTFASWLAKSGSGQAVIAEMLGHSSLEMSRRYTHLMPDAKRDAAAAIDRMFSANEHE